MVKEERIDFIMTLTEEQEKYALHAMVCVGMGKDAKLLDDCQKCDINHELGRLTVKIVDKEGNTHEKSASTFMASLINGMLYEYFENENKK